MTEIAGHDIPVLIRGESGTGKELFAQAIHYLSPRSGKPLVPENCGQIGSDLAANELFGHVVGAYTGASTDSDGLIGRARGGTLLLDEIDSLPSAAQCALLRFLQNNQKRRVGADRWEKVDVRILSSTNADLVTKVETGQFRLDLYHRLKVVELVLPPLRERREDIPLLAAHFLKVYAKQFDRPTGRLSPECLTALDQYHWPGNIRELEGSIESALLHCHTEVLELEHLNLPLQAAPSGGTTWESLAQAKTRATNEWMVNYLSKTLAAAHGKVSQAARLAKINSGSMSKLLRKYQIQIRPSSEASPGARQDRAPHRH